MKTTIHYYRFDTLIPEEKKAYNEMRERIKNNNPTTRGRIMHAFGSYCYREANTSEEIEIEGKHLFDNQWNTIDARVFDHAEDYQQFAKNIKTGHWVEITEEMAKARISNHACGYCGQLHGPDHKDMTDDGFCHTCLDSPYLKESDLNLLRLRAICDPTERPELTSEEFAELHPLYVKRQTTGNDSRANKKRIKQKEDLIKSTQEKIENAENERDGQLWLWEQGFDLSNVIYYSHTKKFCFGWRSPVSEAVRSKILDVISEFPFDYEIKCEDGKELSNC